MTSGFGVDRSADGTSGTSSSDIRKIFGGLYTPGVISGSTVTTSATLMRYTVAAGVAAISTGSGEIILAPIPAGSVTASAAPVSGTRTDIIYAQQHYPSIEGDANLVLGVDTALPARAIQLAKYIVSAGDTNTDQTVRTGGVDYSIPYGANLGLLHRYQDTTNGSYPNSMTRKGHGTIYLPTDRRIKFEIKTVLYAVGAVRFDDTKYCEYGFLPSIDGGDMVLWSTPGLHQAWQTLTYSVYRNVTAGTHEVNYGQFRIVGPGTAGSAYGVDGLGYGREGTIFTVRDDGPAI